MTRAELEHAIRAACDIAHDEEVFVFGSQAILAQFPDAPESLRMSAEADMCPKNNIDATDDLNIIGENSQFHRLHGFYVHGIPITEAAILPTNWMRRTIRISNANTRNKTAYCLEGHDLAASKLAAFRERDRAFVRTLLLQEMIRPRKLIARLRLLPIDLSEQERLVRWVDGTARELRGE
jgi:hypothetical protein